MSGMKGTRVEAAAVVLHVATAPHSGGVVLHACVHGGPSLAPLLGAAGVASLLCCAVAVAFVHL